LAKIDSPQGSSPLIMDDYVSYQGENNECFSETEDVEVEIKTDIISGLCVDIYGYHFEEFKLIDKIPYSVERVANYKPVTIVFVIPKEHICMYKISGFTKKDVKHSELKVRDASSSFASSLDKMHNHEGTNTPKIAVGSLNAGSNVNAIPALDGNGNWIFLSTLPDLPGDFTLTAPINYATFDATAGGTQAFTWGSSSGATSFSILIEDFTAGALNYEADGVVSGMTRNKNTFTNGHTYNWQVTAHNTAGDKTIFRNGWFKCELPAV